MHLGLTIGVGLILGKPVGNGRLPAPIAPIATIALRKEATKTAVPTSFKWDHSEL